MAPRLVAFPVAVPVAVSVAVPVFTVAVAVAREVVAIAAVAVCKKNEGKSNGEYTLRFSSWGGSVASLVQVYEARTMAGRADSELASCKNERESRCEKVHGMASSSVIGIKAG